MAINFFNSLAVGTNVLYVDTLNDRVGVGTTNPTRQLTIFDSTGARLALTSGSSANCNILFGDIRFANSNSSFEHRASIFDFQAQGSSALYINSSRNVGIGTTSPSHNLTINSATGGQLQFQYNTSSRLRIEADSGGGSYYAAAGFYHRFFTSGVERLRIDSSGEVSVYNDFIIDNGSPEMYFKTGGTHYRWMIAAQENVNAALEITPSTTVGGSTYSTPVAVFKATGEVGIGTTSPSSLLNIKGSNGQFLIQNGGAANQMRISSFNNAGNADGAIIFEGYTKEYARIDTSGNVGIGTTSPGGKLHVKDSSTSPGVIIESDGGNEQFVIKRYSNTNEQLILGFHSSDYGTIQAVEQGVSYRNLALNALGGNVGIGTSSPSNGKLQIDSTGNQISIETGTSGDGRLHIGHFSNGTFIGTYGDDGGAADLVRFGTHSGDERMRIDSSGNVGISSTDVQKNLSIGNSQGDGIQFNYDSTNGYRNQILNYWNSSVDSRMDFNIARTANATPETIMSVGYNSSVGIGTSSPSFPLHVRKDSGTYEIITIQNNTSAALFRAIGNGGGTVDFGAEVGTANTAIIRTGGTERLRIDSSGNVGVGTTSPINGGGNAKWITIDGVSGNSYSGGVIYSIGGSAKGYHYVQDNNIIHQGQSGVGHRFIANAGDAMTIVSSNKSINHIGNITSNAMQRPVARWGASGSSTGMIAIALPGDAGDYDMTTIEIEVYEYNSNAGSKIRVSAHTWSSGIGWYNYSISTDGVFNKSIYLGKSSSKYYILLGDTSSSWNYGSVIVRANTEAEFYNNVTPWGDAWSVTQVTTDPTSSKTSNLNTTSSRTSYTYGYSESGSSFRSPIFYDSNDTGYYMDPASTSIVNTVTANDALQAYHIGIRNTSNGTKDGISLYGGATGGEPTYGLMFTGTSGSGTHGDVTGDWATYFTMNNDNSRGWIFRRVGSGNSASISAGGVGTFDSSVKSPTFYDSNNTGYYVDPSGDSKIVGLKLEPGSGNNVTGSDNVLWVYKTNDNDWGIQVDADQGTATDYGFEFFGGSSHSYAYSAVAAGTRYFTVGSSHSQHDGSFRAPIFYDSNNTGYYVDPAGNSQLSRIYYNEWLRNNRSTASGLYWESNSPGYGWHIYPLDQADMYIRAGTANGSLRFTIADETARGYVHWTTSNEVGFLNSSRSWSLKVDNSGNTFATASHRAPIFYDSDNTAYYADPGATSQFNGLTVTNTINGSISGAQGVNITGFGTSNFTFNQGSGSFSAFSGWHNYFIGNHGNGSNYYNTIIAMPFWGSPRYSRLENNTQRGPFEFWTSEIAINSSQNITAPIYYDYNDTGYYVDPASTSNLNVLTVPGSITMGTVSGAPTSTRLKIAGIGNGGCALFIEGASTTSNVRMTLPTFGTGIYIDNIGAFGANALNFARNGTNAGEIIINSGGTTSYSTTSDYRLKENVVKLTNGIERVKQLKPKRFNFILDENKEIIDGFIAHEAKEVVPESVNGEKDEVLPNGDPVYQGIDQAKLVPLLTAALQEAIAKIEDLETRIQILEN
jgi:hypothetical protein